MAPNQQVQASFYENCQGHQRQEGRGPARNGRIEEVDCYIVTIIKDVVVKNNKQ